MSGGLPAGAHWQRPAELGQALAVLASGGWQVLAGGTDFYAARVGRPLPPAVLDLPGIAALRGIAPPSQGMAAPSTDGGPADSGRPADGGPAWRIGATTTWSDIVRAELPPLFHGLVQAAREVGGVQVQNRGTVAGNLCNASPAADGTAMLLALQAEVELSRLDGVRRLPLSRFVLGVRRTALAPGELLTAIHVPQRSPRAWSRFLKLGHRRYLVISIVMVGVLLDFDDGDRVTACGIAVGACAPTARSLTGLEQALLGQPRARLADRAAAWLAADGLQALAPIDDVRGTGAYRREMAAVAIGRLLREAADGTGAGR
ncbi:MAG TPA: FAD binding domain-containing protein [Burkholderiaceae bacterium]|nr:FAD binding domain-containing protein [Burkholderiaceae bacterium]